ncbi:MAG: hypothetical protein CL910_22055 [Deltaproteobacteria bacterium]|nr:hypothetical protein [Deltaproteobacteria bacterium]
MEVCAPCHSRRSRIAPAHPGEPFLDGYDPALLERGLYFPDGQIREEVYVWGSFLQSRMHAQGVTCSDCHDPHSLEIAEPDAVCAGCHRPEVFATPGHHQHPEGSEGASCVACHMPARTYMGIDARRDHGFRIPRPDLAGALGTPDACTGCHADRSPAWASAAAGRWWGEPEPHWTSMAPVERVRGDLPPWIRASALAELPGSGNPRAMATLVEASRDPSALVRLASARLGEALEPDARWQVMSPLLRDPRRAVRLEAARSLAGLGPTASRREEDALLQEEVMEELEASLALVRDRPAGLVQRGDLARRLGQHDQAERAYRLALELGPWFVPAAVNLADLLRLERRDEEGEQVLRACLERVGPTLPESAALHQALGLLLIRGERHTDAVPHLAQAAKLRPLDPRAGLLYGLVLEAVGRHEEARPYLERYGGNTGPPRREEPPQDAK